jgi:hypothetical protein
MKVCIHRGTNKIGGTCVEIESQGKRIVLDVGLLLETIEYPRVSAKAPTMSRHSDHRCSRRKHAPLAIETILVAISGAAFMVVLTPCASSRRGAGRCRRLRANEPSRY